MRIKDPYDAGVLEGQRTDYVERVKLVLKVTPYAPHPHPTPYALNLAPDTRHPKGLKFEAKRLNGVFA